jgi:excisionase family DNA binding protein
MLQTATNTERKAYSVADVAEQTSLSKSFVRNEIRAGRLKAKNIQRRVIILDSDLQNYLENQPDWTPGESKDQKLN